jgi:hypothetical protein
MLIFTTIDANHVDVENENQFQLPLTENLKWNQ